MPRKVDSLRRKTDEYEFAVYHQCADDHQTDAAQALLGDHAGSANESAVCIENCSVATIEQQPTLGYHDILGAGTHPPLPAAVAPLLRLSCAQYADKCRLRFRLVENS